MSWAHQPLPIEATRTTISEDEIAFVNPVRPPTEFNYLLGDVLQLVCQHSRTIDLIRLRQVNKHWSHFSRTPLSWSYSHWSFPNPADRRPEAAYRFKSHSDSLRRARTIHAVCLHLPYLRSIQAPKGDIAPEYWKSLGQLTHLEHIVFERTDPHILPASLTHLKHIEHLGYGSFQGTNDILPMLLDEQHQFMSIRLTDNSSHLLESISAGQLAKTSLIILHLFCNHSICSTRIMSQFLVLEELLLRGVQLGPGETFGAFASAPNLRILTVPKFQYSEFEDDAEYDQDPPRDTAHFEALLSNKEFNRRLEYLSFPHRSAHKYSRAFWHRLTTECTSLLVLIMHEQYAHFRPLTKEDWHERIQAGSTPDEAKLLHNSNERYFATLYAQRHKNSHSVINPPPTPPAVKTKLTPQKLKQLVRHEITDYYPPTECTLGELLTSSPAFRSSLRFLVLRKDRVYNGRDDFNDTDSEFDDDEDEEDLGPWNYPYRPSRRLERASLSEGLLTPEQMHHTRIECLLRFPHLFNVQFGEFHPHPKSPVNLAASVFSQPQPNQIKEIAEWLPTAQPMKEQWPSGDTTTFTTDLNLEQNGSNEPSFLNKNAPTISSSRSLSSSSGNITSSGSVLLNRRGDLSSYEWSLQRRSPFHFVRAIKIQARLPLLPSELNPFMRHAWYCGGHK